MTVVSGVDCSIGSGIVSRVDCSKNSCSFFKLKKLGNLTLKKIHPRVNIKMFNRRKMQSKVTLKGSKNPQLVSATVIRWAHDFFKWKIFKLFKFKEAARIFTKSLSFSVILVYTRGN